MHETRMALRQYDSVLIRLATGGGKTAIAAKMAQNIATKRRRAMFLCHRDFLIDQTAKTFRKFGIGHGFMASGMPWQPHHSIQIGSIGTVKNRLDRIEKPHLIIWDEAHHIAAGGWGKIRQWGEGAKHVLLSATPERMDGKPLKDVCEHMILGPSEAWLIERGYLSKYLAYAPSFPDLSGVHIRAGDYAADELSEKMGTNAVVGDVIHHYNKLARGKRAIYFCVSIDRSEQLAAAFRAAGIMAVHLDGTTPKEDRRLAAIGMALGNIQVITNCSLVGEGYDLSAQAEMDVTVDVIGDVAPTKSYALHRQKLGRAMRPKEDGSPAIFIDHAANIMRADGTLNHGFPDDEHDWTLDGKLKLSSNGLGGPITRQCPKCFHLHRATPLCPACGHEYIMEGRFLKEVEGDLDLLDPELFRKQQKIEESLCETVGDWIYLARARGIKAAEAWAAKRFMAAERTAREREASRLSRSLPQLPGIHNDPL